MDSGKTEETKSFSRKRLYLATFSANLLFVSTGCALTWTPSAISKFKHHLTESEIIWISSVQPIGAIFGPALYSLGIDRIGRKWSLILNAATFLVSWLLIGMSMRCVPAIELGRFIGGLGVGASFNSIPVYITEVSDADNRQMLTSMTELFIAVGYVLTYSTGPYVDYVTLAVICALPAMIFVPVMVTMPESPYYLLAVSQKEKATQALSWLRGSTSVRNEVDLIEAAIKEAKETSGDRKDLFLKRGPRLGFILTLMMLFIQQSSAVDVITTYTEEIFKQPNASVSPSTSAIAVGAVNLFASFAAPFVVQRFGSKPVLVACSLLCGLSLLSFGIYECLQEHEVCDLTSVNALPLVSILVFNVFFCIGLGSVPWAISAELFPPSLKGFALLLSSGLAWAYSFLLIFSYGRLNGDIGKSSLFFTYAITVIIGSVLIGVFIPDTRGKTLKEITDLLDNGNNN